MSGGNHGMSCISSESAIEGANKDQKLAGIMTLIAGFLDQRLRGRH
jgi:hypothetical protein